MVRLEELVGYTDALLDSGRFRDYCPNGLQVEGRREVKTLVSGVTASQAFLEAAAEAGADCVLVHHGYFWKNERAVVTGMKRRRIKMLLDHGISLLAYHLPLDAHPDVGNNAALARHLGFHTEGVATDGPGRDILFYGRPAEPASLERLAGHVGRRLGCKPLAVAGSGALVASIAWCTGGAQHFIEQALSLGVDAYLSGEISEQTTHIAREEGIHYIAAGHHATERYGPAALGGHLAGRFELAHRFVDIDNPA